MQYQSWNPLTGCTKISIGCKNCYAERIAGRLRDMGVPNYINGFQLTLHEDMLELPLRWKKSRMIFVNSMGDLFHKDVPLRFIQKVFTIMARAKQHQFQVLTKRADRLGELSPRLRWTENVWMGVTVESAEYLWRIAELKRTDAAVKFLSIEPLLGPVSDLDLKGIDWVIAGGESGPRARPVRKEWIREIRDQCVNANIPFFFKQWGGTDRKKSGRMLDGRRWEEMPAFRSEKPVQMELF